MIDDDGVILVGCECCGRPILLIPVRVHSLAHPDLELLAYLVEE